MKNRHFSHLTSLALACALVSCAVLAGNEANPDAVELAPIPVPVEFSSDMDKPVAFDATATVTVECPDASAAGGVHDSSACDREARHVPHRREDHPDAQGL